jgi:hypothetical protein
MAQANEWSRKKAEADINRLLETAKTSGYQTIEDFDGTFVITFSAAGESAKAFLKFGYVA